MNAKITPMIQQWHDCKQQAKESLLLFRLGDFYEAFYDDAKTLAKELQLTLTQRQGIPMSGIPVHAVENYLEKLINRGHKVSIAEQLESPSDAKGIVKREIIRTVSPATYLDSPYQQDVSNKFMVALVQVNSIIGMALLDLSTGEFKVTELESLSHLLDEIIKRRPKEILVARKFYKQFDSFLQQLKLEFSYRLNVKDDWAFDFQISYEWLKTHFGVHSLDGFGLKQMTAAINAAGSLLAYVNEDLYLEIKHIRTIAPLFLDEYLSIDAATFKHLNIMGSPHEADASFSLFDLLNQTKTAMGSRMMKHLVAHPSTNLGEIHQRQDAISYLIQEPKVLQELQSLLHEIRDIERLIMKICGNYAGPRDIKALGLSLQMIPLLQKLLEQIPILFFRHQQSHFFDCKAMSEEIIQSIVDTPPLKITEGGIFNKGYNKELDVLIHLKENSEEWLKNYQEQLRKLLDLKTLKVGFNHAFGYFIEVSRLQAKSMPSTFYKKQTLVNTERFISEELQEFETKILHAEENVSKLEYTLFQQLREKISLYEVDIRKAANACAWIDCIVSLASVSKEHGYIRPIIDYSNNLHITHGRHPTIEAKHSSHSFIPNDTNLNEAECQLMLITGPNMAGKSTYIRQVALLCIMAQIGCFIPAASATIGIVDKVFSRIGASDDLLRGQSTFMVEMSETANILNNVTSKSIVILDEIGRGTSTYDGVAIAFAVAEYLLTTEGKKAKTLFATHYHELTSMSELFPKAKNFRVEVEELEDNIVFLRKIVPGGSDKSFGIHVAKLAGLPPAVIQKAKEKLKTFQEIKLKQKPTKTSLSEEDQLLLFPLDHVSDEKKKKILEQIKEIDILKTSPLDAFEYLIKWQENLKKI
ncbi:MAG: DNA mismatch repair protein MutS [Chlamydiales bacterium]|nr:DNA mismatch repair protein MutS [Chlamydiales bacterium]